MKKYVIAIKDYYLSKEEQEGFTLVTFPREIEFATKYHDKQQADKIAEEYGGKVIEVLEVHGQSGQVYYQEKTEDILC